MQKTMLELWTSLNTILLHGAGSKPVRCLQRGSSPSLRDVPDVGESRTNQIKGHSRKPWKANACFGLLYWRSEPQGTQSFLPGQSLMLSAWIWDSSCGIHLFTLMQLSTAAILHFGECGWDSCHLENVYWGAAVRLVSVALLWDKVDAMLLSLPTICVLLFPFKASVRR